MFSTVSGLEAALATCDLNLRQYYTYVSTTDNPPIVTEMIFSDIAVIGASGATYVNDFSIDVITQLVPDGKNDSGWTNRTAYFGFGDSKVLNMQIQFWKTFLK